MISSPVEAQDLGDGAVAVDYGPRGIADEHAAADAIGVKLDKMRLHGRRLPMIVHVTCPPWSGADAADGAARLPTCPYSRTARDSSTAQRAGD